MTIDEAIAQLKDLRKDREGFLANDEPDSEFAKDIEAIDMALEHMDLHGTYIGMSAHNELYAKYEKQKSINYELVEENQEFVTENAELKRLLRLAVDGFEHIGKHFTMCSHDDCDKCPYYIGERLICPDKWKHAEEASELLGDEDNEQ